MATKTRGVVRTHPEDLDRSEYAVLYLQARDNFDAIVLANEWAQAHGFVRARELTLGRARVGGEEFYVARCYRPLPEER